ncbi:MAG: hypothetical protein ACOYJS_05350 [Acutalibacteraceae bacterium]|jgi:hypothetical protein
MSENEFLRQQQEAIANMRRMNARACRNTAAEPQQNIKSTPPPHSPPPPPPAPRINPPKHAAPPKSDFPFLDFLKNSETSLIIGLLLLLLSENADQKLLLALVYILI